MYYEFMYVKGHFRDKTYFSDISIIILAKTEANYKTLCSQG